MDTQTHSDTHGFEPGKGNAYDLLPAWMRVPALGKTECQRDPLAVIKLFSPSTIWTWYVMEYDGQDTLFGLVIGFETELGYFSLSELREVRGPLGLRVERDLWFAPTPITDLPEYPAKWGYCGGPYGGENDAPAQEPCPQERDPGREEAIR